MSEIPRLSRASKKALEFEKGHTYQITKVKTSTGEADFFLEDACHPLREMVKLSEGRVNRIK